MNNHSIESHFTLHHSASFSSQWSITIKKILVNKRRKNSKYKTGIDYNEENKWTQSTKEVCCS